MYLSHSDPSILCKSYANLSRNPGPLVSHTSKSVYFRRKRFSGFTKPLEHVHLDRNASVIETTSILLKYQKLISQGALFGIINSCTETMVASVSQKDGTGFNFLAFFVIHDEPMRFLRGG